MPPTRVHFNGSINLPDTDAVLRELGARIGTLATRYSDGETGDRANWIWFQLQRFWETPGLERLAEADAQARYGGLPKVRLADGADPSAIGGPTWATRTPTSPRGSASWRSATRASSRRAPATRSSTRRHWQASMPGS